MSAAADTQQNLSQFLPLGNTRCHLPFSLLQPRTPLHEHVNIASHPGVVHVQSWWTSASDLVSGS